MSEKRSMNDIVKVTVFAATATTVEKDGKTIVVPDRNRNKWVIGVFTKSEKFTLADFVGRQTDKKGEIQDNGIEFTDDKIKKYIGSGKHSNIVVLAHEFATEFAFKESSAITEWLEACTEIVNNEKAEKAKEKAYNKEHRNEVDLVNLCGKAEIVYKRQVTKDGKLRDGGSAAIRDFAARVMTKCGVYIKNMKDAKNNNLDEALAAVKAAREAAKEARKAS